MKRKNEILLGLVIVLASVILVYGFNYLKGQDLFKTYKQYYAIYENVDGLTEDASVRINGFPVGKVTEVRLLPDVSGKILVGFQISNENVNIPINSRAKIASLDLLGSKAILLEFPIDSTTKKIIVEGYYNSGDTLISDIQESLQESVNREVLPLKKKTEELIGSIDSAVIIVQTILNKDARDNLSKSFESIKRGIQTFETTSMRLDTMIATEKARISNIFGDMESITSNIRRNNEEITNVIENFSSISDTLAKANIAQALNNASVALNQVSGMIEKINNGEGSMGMLINDSTLYSNLSQAAMDLDLLLADMKENPDRYVHFSAFGRKNKKAGGTPLSKKELKKLKDLLNEEDAKTK